METPPTRMHTHTHSRKHTHTQTHTHNNNNCQNHDHPVSSVSPILCQSAGRSVFMSFYTCDLYLCLSNYISLCLSVSMSANISMCLSACLYISVYLSNSLQVSSKVSSHSSSAFSPVPCLLVSSLAYSVVFPLLHSPVRLGINVIKGMLT